MLTLVIADKTYSSWSLRAWLLLTEAGIAFEEVRLGLATAAFTDGIGRYSPAGRVPVLIDDGVGPTPLAVWDTLAIAEYAAERFPEKRLWPEDVAARARARSICAEMHAGFSALRSAMPMNVTADLAGFGWSVAVQDDVDRLCAMWTELLDTHGGPLLFGDRFTIPDAYFAPVMSRFATYAVALPPRIAAYRDAVLARPGMQRWIAGARTETAFVVDDEPYRRARP